MRGVCYPFFHISLAFLFCSREGECLLTGVGFVVVAYGDKRPKRLVERSSSASATPSTLTSGSGKVEGEGEK